MDRTASEKSLLKIAAEKSLLKKSYAAIIFIVLILAVLQIFFNISSTVGMIIAIVSAIIFSMYGIYKLGQIEGLDSDSVEMEPLTERTLRTEFSVNKP